MVEKINYGVIQNMVEYNQYLVKVWLIMVTIMQIWMVMIMLIQTQTQLDMEQIWKIRVVGISIYFFGIKTNGKQHGEMLSRIP